MTFFTRAALCVLLTANIVACDIACDDPSYECPDDTTCCLMKDGTWGCCPMPNAVCCQDKEHCCPEDTICDLKRLTCNQTSDDGRQIRMSVKIVAKQQPNDITCDDQATQCPAGTTCCQMIGGRWGCCPYEHAVCCSDNIHCCPEQTTCDTEQGTCDPGGANGGGSGSQQIRVPWMRKFPAMTRSSDNQQQIQCDQKTSCPDDTTCCKLKTGKWGCCPMPNAVCCSDGEHCCPQATICDVQQGKCIQNDVIRRNIQLTLMMGADVTCDDQTTKCPEGTTCCKTADGRYGCCPMENATCCSDGLHCCPEHTLCDVASQTCTPESRDDRSFSMPWVRKLPANRRKSFRLGDDVQCDGQFSCPDETTCCKLQSGQWGCCPMPRAVCCSDNVHCCPQNTECDVETRTCTHGGASIRQKLIKRPYVFTSSAFRNSLKILNPKLPSFLLLNSNEQLEAPKMITCPDGRTHCISDMSCCQTNEGFGCCPFTNGQCCSNKQFCCPNGSTCNGTTCQAKIGATKLIRFDASKLITIQQGSTQEVQCKSGLYSCPQNSKCCKTLFFGQYGCCPDPEGVCCADGASCCPKGYICKKDGQCSAI